MVHRPTAPIASAKSVPKIELSDVGLRALRPPAKGPVDYWDTKIPSFGCRVSQGGAKTFILKIQNSRRRIGRYPTISLSDARTEAKRQLAERTLGKVRPQSITVQQARELFLAEKRKGRRPRTVDDLTDRLTRHFDIKGQLADVTHGEVVRRLNNIKTSAEHNAALRVGKGFFTWAVNRRYISDNPFRGIDVHTTQSRERVLTDEELAKIWLSLADASAVENLPANYRTIVKLLILMGQRRGEITALQSSWINEKEKTITLPASVTKNGREHCFPIGALAAQTLKPKNNSDATPFLFLARGTTDRPFNGWSKSKAILDKLSGVKNWTLHDLRRTYRTIHARIGTPPHIAERLVNHVSARSAMQDVYDRHTYLPEMRQAVENYEAYLIKLLRC